ncbi:thiamine pyrophosphate-dependent enzyme [Actinosynnema sp. NPDC023658]|uniref:thiamine pyrophosphate-dependent enzyme n=1 Tax=Actinosynnema sp. NPDC023658 TaxID=3155465 RepID=UPI0033DD4389
MPIIAINASPTSEQWLNFQAVGLLTSHMSTRRESNLDVYRQVTVDAQVITNPGLAPRQVDTAIVACLTEQRPVYLEVMEDVWDATCPAPVGVLAAEPRPFTPKNETMLTKSVKAAVALVGQLGTPVLWAGEEVDRFDLAEQFLSLVEETGIPFATTIGGKAVVSEDHPSFLGVYNGKASTPEVYRAFQEVAKVRIGIGSWATSKNLGGAQHIGSDWIVAARDGVSVGPYYYPGVPLDRFTTALRDALVREFGAGHFTGDYYARGHAAGLDVPESTAARHADLGDDCGRTLTYDSLFCRVTRFLREHPDRFTVVSDAGFALLGSMDLHIAEKDTYFAQNSWLSIGYSVGATTGVALARPDRRPLVFVGDGSFQETAQEVSTHVRPGLKPVIFVLDNDGFYGIEQMLVEPCFYTKPPTRPADYYNVLHPWNYDQLDKVFGSEKTPMTGYDVTDVAELDGVLNAIGGTTDQEESGPVVVRVRLNRSDYPRAIGYKVSECGPQR